MRHTVPLIRAQCCGRILNTVSDAWAGIASLSAYGAANAAVIGLTKSIVKEPYKAGITVNAFGPQALSPGHVSFNATLRTMLAAQSVEVRDEARLRESEEAHGSAENLTFVAYLASEAASEVSGGVFTVRADGTVARWAEPQWAAKITKAGAPWTLQELATAVPDELLKGWTPPAQQGEF